MFSNQREKLLAIVLGGSLAFAVGYDAVDRMILSPISDARSHVQAATTRNRDLQMEFELVKHAQKNLKTVSGQSLPSEPSVATLMYQDWLLDRVKDASLSEAVVTPGRAIPETDVGHRIPFTLQATAGLRQIGRFLDNFYQAPLLHRITFMSIDNAGNTTGSDRKLVMTLEALALEDAPARESLQSPDSSPQKPAGAKLEHYFARTDPFRRTVIKPVAPVFVKKPAAADKPTTTAPKIDPLTTIRLVASIWKSGQREAWFFDSRTGKEFIVAAGEELNLTDFNAKVISIDEDSITMASQDTSHTTRLGQTLRESMKPVVN